MSDGKVTEMEVGQVWEDCDKRSADKTGRAPRKAVVRLFKGAVSHARGELFAVLVPVEGSRGRPATVEVKKFLGRQGTRSGYRLVGKLTKAEVARLGGDR